MNRTKTNSCKIGIKPHEVPDSESNQEKKEQSQKYHTPYFKLSRKSTVSRQCGTGTETDTDQ